MGSPLAWALWSALDEQELGALTSRRVEFDSRELVEANLKELGLNVAKAVKAIGVRRRQLYNVINGRSAVTPEIAVRFEKTFGGGADVWLRMQAAHDLAKVRQPEEATRDRHDVSRFRPAVVEGIADRTTSETSRKLLAALAK